MKIELKCRQLLDIIETHSPVLVYGEAASGKTIFTLSIAYTLSTRLGAKPVLITTEPQSTLPAASRILPAYAEIHIAYSLADIAEQIVEIAQVHRQRVILVIDSLTAPYRLEVWSDPILATKLLAFTLAVLYKLSNRYPVLVVSQVHENPEEGGEEPVAYDVTSNYAHLAIRIQRVADGTRLIVIHYPSNDSKVLFEAHMTIAEGLVEIEC